MLTGLLVSGSSVIKGNAERGSKMNVPTFEDSFEFGTPSAEVIGIEKLAMISRMTSADQFKK